MPKAPSSQAGPSSGGSKGRPVKVIQKTGDMMEREGSNGGKGKAKESAVFGGLNRLIGETKSLPNAIMVEKFAKIRAIEILALQNAIKSAASQGSTRVFQTLPRHLRRRAASHNPRRVPKRLRARAAAEIDPYDTIAKVHRKRAKIRSKGNLRGQSRTTQLLLRQRDKKWLPTHMYHAKRFHMINLWGYRLPLTPTLKSFRPAYRASKRGVMVFDTSYHGFIELEGMREDLTNVLRSMTGSAFAGSKYENGSRVVETTLYHSDKFPIDFIGPIEIFWNPNSETSTKIWIKVHPSIFEESFDALKLAISKYAGSSTSSPLYIRDLREDLGSFEIVGPKGGRLLRRIFKLCRGESAAKKRFFGSLGDPAFVTKGMITGLRIYDPRLSFPPATLPEDRPVAEDKQGSSSLFEPSSQSAKSDLWNVEDRDRLLNPTFTKADLDRRRHDSGLPGTRLKPLAHDDRIPLLLVSQGDRYTIIFPRGWSQAILHSIVYTPTLLGALEERRTVAREAGFPSFPEHYGAVCKAGKEWEESVAAEDERRWRRKPPGRRIDNPIWRGDWKRVFKVSEEDDMNGQSGSNQDIWVLPKCLGEYADKAEGAINAFRKQRGMTSLPAIRGNGVVHVKLETEGRGSPGRMAEIYALDKHERKEWLEAVDKGSDRINQDIPPALKLGEDVPKSDSLIGFTRTGNFSLTRGKGFALGLISLEAWNELSRVAREEGDGRGVVVKVRSNGGRLCRLAVIEMV